MTCERKVFEEVFSFTTESFEIEICAEKLLKRLNLGLFAGAVKCFVVKLNKALSQKQKTCSVERFKLEYIEICFV